jgi:hypothetical protein
MAQPWWRRVLNWWGGKKPIRLFTYLVEVYTDNVGRAKKGSLLLGQGDTGWEVVDVLPRRDIHGNGYDALILRSRRPLTHCDIQGNAILVAELKK